MVLHHTLDTNIYMTATQIRTRITPSSRLDQSALPHEHRIFSHFSLARTFLTSRVMCRSVVLLTLRPSTLKTVAAVLPQITVSRTTSRGLSKTWDYLQHKNQVSIRKLRSTR